MPIIFFISGMINQEVASSYLTVIGFHPIWFWCAHGLLLSKSGSLSVYKK